MYLGKPWAGSAGGDTGEWWTTFVEIPIKTPSAKIEKVATEKLWAEIEQGESLDISEIAFVGLYYLPSLEELKWRDEDLETEGDEER
jgi:hypothetical protein